MQDFLRKYLNLTFPAGEEGGGASLAEPPAAVVVPDPAVASEATPEPAAEPAPAPGNQQPWYLRRLAEEAAGRRQEAERATAAERRALEAEALADRLRAGSATTPAQVAPPPATDSRQQEINTAAAAQRLYEDSVEVRQRGMAQFGAAFGETLSILGAIGATSDDFVSDVLAVDKANAHTLLKKIAEDPERAVALTQMNSRQRVAELARMTIATATKTDPAVPTAAAPVTKTAVSRAPAPPPPVQPSASKVVNWRTDDASDAEFTQGFKEEFLKKRSIRR